MPESRKLNGSKAWDGYYLSYAKGYLCDEVNHYKTLTYADESTYHIHALLPFSLRLSGTAEYWFL